MTGEGTERLILYGVVGLETTWSFSAFCPSVFTIGEFKDRPDAAVRVRSGYILGAAFGLAFAGVVSWLLLRTNDPYWWVPLAISGTFGAGFILVYEAAIRGVL